MARNIDDKHEFWSMIFGIDKLNHQNSKLEMLTPKDKFTCNVQNYSLWDLFNDVNNDVLNDLSKIIHDHPSCKTLVKCEILHLLPDFLHK